VSFTADQEARILGVLNEKTSSRKCTACGGNYRLAPDVYLLQKIQGVGYNEVPMGGGQPCISVVCEQCGNVLLFNIFRLGLADYLGIKPAKVPTNG
jgi:hypothetical protein